MLVFFLRTHLDQCVAIQFRCAPRLLNDHQHFVYLIKKRECVSLIDVRCVDTKLCHPRQTKSNSTHLQEEKKMRQCAQLWFQNHRFIIKSNFIQYAFILECLPFYVCVFSVTLSPRYLLFSFCFAVPLLLLHWIRRLFVSSTHICINTKYTVTTTFLRLFNLCVIHFVEKYFPQLANWNSVRILNVNVLCMR